MKNLALIGLIIMATTACHKFEKGHKETQCATVSSETIPQSVRDSFMKKYPGTNATTWFNKDNNGYYVEFIQSAVKTLAQFSNDGTFVKEEGSTNQQGEHQHNDDDSGCSCELEGTD